MIKVENVKVWGFEHAIRGMELELLKYLFNHYQNKGYHKNKYRKHSKGDNYRWGLNLTN